MSKQQSFESLALRAQAAGMKLVERDGGYLLYDADTEFDEYGKPCVELHHTLAQVDSYLAGYEEASARVKLKMQ